MTIDLFAPETLSSGLLPVLLILMIQVILGGLDNLLHHEMTEALPTKPSARFELGLHSARELIYAGVFLVFALFKPTGLWAVGFAVVLGLEILITLADFLEEDRTRVLPPFERVLHTVLALNYGAVLALLAPVLWAWAQEPTAWVHEDRGAWTPLLIGAAVGVGAWGIRDGWARLTLKPAQTRADPCLKVSGNTVLITGGTGFLGRDLVQNCLNRGDQVVVLSRNLQKARRILGPKVRLIDHLDGISPGTRIDQIVNLAGANVADQLWTNARKATLYESRLSITQSLVKLMERLERKPSVFISASAAGFYGDRGDTALTEESDPQPGVFTSDLCQAWEQAAMPAEALGVRTVRLRLGLVFGRDGAAFPKMAMSRPLGVVAQFGHGQQWLPWIHKTDALGLVEHALDHQHVAGAMNAVAPGAARHKELIKALAGRRLILPIPAFILKRVLGEMSDIFLHSQKLRAHKALSAGYVFRYADLNSAVANLTARKHPSVREPAHV